MKFFFLNILEVSAPTFSCALENTSQSDYVRAELLNGARWERKVLCWSSSKGGSGKSFSRLHRAFSQQLIHSLCQGSSTKSFLRSSTQQLVSWEQKRDSKRKIRILIRQDLVKVFAENFQFKTFPADSALLMMITGWREKCPRWLDANAGDPAKKFWTSPTETWETSSS